MKHTPAEMRFLAQMSSALDNLGIKHHKLTKLSRRVWADERRVVVKIGDGPDGDSSKAAALDYLRDLESLEAGGVRCEPRLRLEPVEFTDGVWGVVLGWVTPDSTSGEPLVVPPRQLGAYVRAVHDALSAGDSGIRAGWVRCPDDWALRNIVVSGGEPVLVDLDWTHDAPRGDQVERAAWELLPHLSDYLYQKARKEFMDGYGPY